MNIKALQKELISFPPKKIMEWAKDQFAPHLVMTSAFGASGMVLIHMIKDVYPEIPIFFLDTGFHFQETLDFIKKIKMEMVLNVIRLKPEISQAELKLRYGDRPYDEHNDRCCHINKVLPLEKAFKDYQVKGWLTALRRDQSESRKSLPVILKDSRGIIKINPLVRWKRADIWAYIMKNNIPYNPLHDESYPSIGCAPCTRQVDSGAHEREGRWAGTGKLECGIHIAPAAEAVDLDEAVDIERHENS